MSKAYTHLIKVWLFDCFSKNYSKVMIYAAMIERFKFLGDKLENIEIETLSHVNDREVEKHVKTPKIYGGKK